MRRRSIHRVTVAAIGVVLLLSPAVLSAGGGQGGVRLVSNDLFDLLEQWSGEGIGYEETALDAYPEAIESYVDEVRDIYLGRSLGEHFVANYPEAADEYMQATEGEISEDADFVAYVMGHRQAEYQRWQAEGDLQNGGRFDQHVARYHPEVVAQTEAANVAPAAKGITLTTFARDLGREDLVEEILSVLPPTPAGDCECWVAMATPSQPYDTELEIDEHVNESWGFPKKRKRLDYTVTSLGVAKEMDFDRYTRHTLWEQDRTKGANHSQLRVRPHCTESGVAGGQQCQGATCTGELALAVEYATRVREEVDVGGIWSKRARTVAADTAFLRYDPPGPGAEMILFEKGVGVSGDTKTGWSLEGIVQSIVAGTELVTNIVEEGVDGIEEDLLNEFLSGIFSLTTREGDPGTHDEDMYVRFDTANSVPFPLPANTTQLFTLDTKAYVYSRGYGGRSESWADVKSSHFISGVARNFQCSGGATPPEPGACWLWGTGGGPHSSGTLQGLVSDFVYTELGATPSGTSEQRNCFP